MSYKTREAKRRKSAAIHGAKRKNPNPNPRYYLTKVRYDCRCSSCGAKLRKRGDMVYRQLGPVSLCVGCADGDPRVDYLPSLRWEKARTNERKMAA
jgi:hypothetical protein